MISIEKSIKGDTSKQNSLPLEHTETVLLRVAMLTKQYHELFSKTKYKDGNIKLTYK